MKNYNYSAYFTFSMSELEEVYKHFVCYGECFIFVGNPMKRKKGSII